jgi:hypothetical protein
MKKGAYLLNASRGNVVCSKACVTASKSRTGVEFDLRCSRRSHSLGKDFNPSSCEMPSA